MTERYMRLAVVILVLALFSPVSFSAVNLEGVTGCWEGFESHVLYRFKKDGSVEITTIDEYGAEPPRRSTATAKLIQGILVVTYPVDENGNGTASDRFTLDRRHKVAIPICEKNESCRCGKDAQLGIQPDGPASGGSAS